MEIMTVPQTLSFSSLPPSTLPFFQSLSKLLEEDLEHPLTSEERDHDQDDQDDLTPAGVSDEQDSALQWVPNTRDQPENISMGDDVIRRFFSDLLSLSRRYQGRRKKSLSRGCFGVRLDRIGSLSGLGCWVCHGKRKSEVAGLSSCVTCRKKQKSRVNGNLK